ncbi:Queuosine precursor transporter [compost metagenome]
MRLLGKGPARQVIARVMLPALAVSYVVSVLFQEGAFRGAGALLEFNTFVARISLASFLAYVLGQVLDIQVFDRLRKLSRWWIAPVLSTIAGNLLDTFAFFSIAFWRSGNAFMAQHWVEIATVDYGVKLAVSLILFVPLYGVLLNAILRRLTQRSAYA